MRNNRLRVPFFLMATLLLAFHTPQYGQFVDFFPWEESGIVNGLGAPSGITVEDYDGDNWIDLLILNGSLDADYSNTLYRNTGNGFEIVDESILPPHPGKYNAGAFADFNGDRNKDLFLGAWNYGTNANTQNRLLAGHSSGPFTTASAGSLVTNQNSTTGCSWADINGDGWLDIFVANNSTSFGSAPNALYLNLGDGTFYQEEESIIVTGTPRFSFSGNWADVDGDRDLDLYVANAWAPDQLFYNNGSGQFSLYEDEEAFFNINTALTYNGTWGDYDNDGDFDLFVPGQSTNFLYQNDGTGSFRRVEGDWEQSLLTPVGAWGDFDNDGDLDLFVTSFQGNQNQMFRNDNGQLELENDANFPSEDGFAGLADFDNDGFLDIALANGGFPNTDLHTALYLNSGNDNNWVQFTLVANAPNTSAIGAVVRVKATINGQETWQMRQVASSSHQYQSTRLHFGLGDMDTIEQVIIEWPDGQVEAYDWRYANVHCTIQQGEDPKECLVSGLNDRGQLRAKLTLNPNPAKEQTLLQLETEKTIGQCTISLFYLTGQLAWSTQQELHGTRLNQEINLRGLPAGLYNVQVEAEGKRIARNLVITP